MKRANGTGTIVKLSGPRRRPYVVKVPDRDSRGRIVQRPLGYYAKANEAQAELDRYNALREAGQAPAPNVLNYTVQDVYDGWSAREYKKLEEKGRKSSLNSHRAAWNKRISRYAGRKIRNVTLDEWQSVLDEDEDNGLSQSLITNDAILIRALYAYAMKRDLVEKDYSQYLEVPSVDPKNPKGALTDIQLAKLEQIAAEGFPWADTALMLCYMGYRITEFLTLSPFQYHPDAGGYFTAGIKTDAGRDRIVPVHPKIEPYLQKYLALSGDTIVVGEGGQHITAQWYRETAFPPIMRALGLPDATPHWCRHTFNTRLLTAGVDDITRKMLMGHSVKANVNAGYAHPPVEWFVQAVRKLA